MYLISPRLILVFSIHNLSSPSQVETTTSMSSAQNIYDNPTFFSAYGTLPRSQLGLAGAPGWPDLRSMVLRNSLTQSLQGQRVLDLGCGYGWFARWARDSGAAYVKGVDISAKMISRAREAEMNLSPTREIQYEVADIESITFGNSSSSGQKEKEAYDLVYSSLTLHYIEDLSRLYREIHAALETGDKFVFSVEHPICSAPVNPGPDWKSIQEEGEGGGQEHKIWPLNRYSDEGWRVTSWLGVDGVRKYHRTVETYVQLLLQNGFALTGFRDWVPSLEDVAQHPEWKDERRRPYFLLISAERK